MRIPRRFLRALLLRGTALWFLARGMAIVIIAWAAQNGGRGVEMSDGAWALLPWWTLAMTPALVLLDLHRRREVLLLNNLGIVTGRAVFIGTIPSFVMEAAMLAARA